MKKTILSFSFLFVILSLSNTTNLRASELAAGALNKMPLAFTKNMGQWDEQVLYRANAGGATMWFTKKGVTYQFIRRIEKSDADQLSRMDSHLLGKDMEPDSVEQLVITAKFVGANPNPEIVGEGLMEYKCNYFIGNDPNKWYVDVPNYEAITLKDVYPGIDLQYSGDGNAQAAYKIIVAPGADLAPVKVEYEGAEETSIDADGRLILKTKWGDMIASLRPPSDSTASRTCGLRFKSELELQYGYPVMSREAQISHGVGLVFGTFLGGGSSDEADDVAVDDGGNVYVAGITWSTDFPGLNPLQQSLGGGADVFVTELSSQGSSLVYSTFLGGSDYDSGWGVAVDKAGCAFVTGLTESDNFPTIAPLDATLNGSRDAFILRIGPNGNELLYSTYLGGSDEEIVIGDFGKDVVVDAAGNAYVTGITTSTDFPLATAFDDSFNGEHDAFVTKLNPSGSSLIYSTYLGGINDEYAMCIDIDKSGSAYLTGFTCSVDFPTVNAFDSDFNGNYSDAFVTKFSPSGTSLAYSTFLGGSNEEGGYTELAIGIAVDSTGSAYLTGSTQATDFPIVSPFDDSLHGYMDAFVAKLDSDGSELIYSTFLGGKDGEEGDAIDVDEKGCAYVTGFTGSADFPTTSPSCGTLYGSADVFVTKLDAIGDNLVFSTYLGGNSWDCGVGIAVDQTSDVYVVGRTDSQEFPVVNPFDGRIGGSSDAFVSKLHEFLCGDANDSGSVSISDVVYLINYIFAGGPAPNPVIAGDANCSGAVSISDAVYLINYIFSGGAAPCAACK